MSDKGVMYEPCAQCPFRTDRPAFLTKRRARNIVQAIMAQADFYCHKTVDYEGEADGQVTADSKVCAGFAVLCENMNKPTQMMRILERIGMYDARRLNRNAPVHQTAAAFIQAQPK